MEKWKKYKSALYYLALIAVTGLVGYISLGRGFDFDVVNSTNGDGFSTMAGIKSIQERGIWGAWFNYRTGAPGVSTLIDFPAWGLVDDIIYCVLSCFTDSTPRIAYMFLIVSFPLDGIAMSLLMRKLNFNEAVSFVFSSLFAFAPFHFIRYLGHSTLIVYISIPAALYLGGCIVGIIDETKKWKLIAVSVVLGIGYGYYYAFGLIVLAVSYLVRFIKLDNKKEILRQLWIGVAVSVSIFVGLLPQITYSIVNGKNLEAGNRIFWEQEIYGLKIINLLLPVPYSRNAVLRNLTESYASSGAPIVTENYFAGLGIIGSLGFAALCITFIISFVGKKYAGKEWELVDYLALVTLTFVLTGTVGGFGEIFNWAVTAQIRCWNRCSILLTCTCLLMVAVMVSKIRNRRRLAAVCVMLLLVGMYDQVRVLDAGWQDGNRDIQRMYESYFDEVEGSLNENAMVYQLPYVEYPEAGWTNNLSDYELFAGYLFTDTLRWSYGSMRGRNEYARELNVDEGMSYRFLAKIKEKGFEAVYIDLDGYADGGEKILAFYNGLGITPLVSGDGKLYVYDISEVEVTDGMLTPGYSFVKMMSEKYNADASDEDMIKLAKGLSVSDMAAYSTLWCWFVSGEPGSMTDEEYVENLYILILNRKPDDGGKAGWIEAIQNGMQRESVFQSFLGSEEFKETVINPQPSRAN